MTDGLKDKDRSGIRAVLAASPKVRRAVLFGSRALETFRGASDVDLALEGTDIRLQDLLAIQAQIAKLNLPVEVDLVVRATISNPELEKHIKAYGREWYRKGWGMACDTITECTVGDVAAPSRNALVGGPFGSDLVSRDYVPSGVPVIRGTNMGHGRWVAGEFAYVTREKADSLASNCARGGDLVFTQRGTLGQVALVPKNGADRYLISQSQMKLTVDDEKADAVFLYYVFTSAEQQAHIRQHAIQTGVPHTNLGILRNAPLALPPLAEQKAIAAVLGALDDKIELNRRMNATLEAMARALFQSWFVDFDPVRAKLDGRPPAGLDKATAALFPAAFQDSPLGPIPQGWRVMKFGDFINRLSVGQKYDQKSVSPVGSVPVFDQGKSGVIGFHNNEAGVKATLDEPVAVFANHTCYMRLITYSFSTIQNVLPFVGNSVCTFWAYYATEGRLSFSEYKGHWPDFVIQEAVVPSRVLTDIFGRVVKPLVARIRSNDDESRTLATLRDTLLPKLLSGQLRLPLPAPHQDTQS